MTNVPLFVFCCCVFHGVLSQNSITTLVYSTPTQSNQEDLLQQNVLETITPKKDKFTCVLNLLKSALTEEIESAKCNNDETTQQTILNNLNNLLEGGQMKDDDGELIQNIINPNETESENALYTKVINKIASVLTKPKNNTHIQGSVAEIPSMIPIFKPKTVLPLQMNNQKQNMVECRSSIAPKLNPNPRTYGASCAPENIIQTNVNSIPNQPMFNIPCQRAADILDMTNIVIPEEVCGNGNAFEPLKIYSNLPEIMPNSPKQSPITLSVNCADTEDTVAMLFKPKTISLMQLYGNLLKNITITVLVPYHMSKLAAN